jgi:hypothetical protein
MPAALATPATIAQRTASDEASFDLWLERELSRLYDDVLRDPVPASMLRILDEVVGDAPGGQR